MVSHRKAFFALMLLLGAATLALSMPAGVAGDELGQVVTPRGTFPSLAVALEGAIPGETLAVYGGVHHGPFTITQPVNLIGHDWPRLQGTGRGSVLSIEAPGVSVTGFEIAGSGIQLYQEDSGIEVNAPGGLIAGNRIRDALFGIYLRESHGSVIRNNEITGMDLDPARRGDAIRLWSSHGASVEDNVVTGGRDVVLWYSKDLTVRGNEVTGGRYGLHFMYCDDARVTDNRLIGNSVGAFLMYSRRLELERNVIAENRGPSGYGIGLKDIDDAVIEGNLFADNRVGGYIDNSPRESDSSVVFTSNSFVLNDFGLRLMPSVHDNEYTGNAFIDNGEQVAVVGGGSLAANRWSVDGRGNYWSDYNGYDGDRDGYGDIPYRSDHLFERLSDETPVLRLLQHSPAVQAIDFASRIAPFTKPEPKLVDLAPQMAPGAAARLKVHTEWSWVPLLASSLGLAGAALLVAAIGTRLPSLPGRGRRVPAARAGLPLVSFNRVSKAYGSNRVLDGLAFDLSPGEGLALWGPNGAGKTTAVRCLLGITGFKGSIEVGGYDVMTRGKLARDLIGFVPQESGFSADTTVNDTLAFFARLRQASPEEPEFLLTQMGLAGHRKKRVGELSGGLRQRLAIAVALLGDPPLLVMDEPTANLDAAGRDDVLSVLARLRNDGKSLVLASHRPDEIGVLADRVLVIESGRIVEDVPVNTFVNRNVHSVTLRLRVEGEVADGAVQLLNKQGFSAKRSANHVIVMVGSMSKAAPVSTLSKAGFNVIDFDYSGPSEGAQDA